MIREEQILELRKQYVKAMERGQFGLAGFIAEDIRKLEALL